jgi:DNA modification methylase
MRGQGAYLGGDYASKKKYFLQNNSKSEFEHPTVKPLNIIRTLVVNSSKENDLVFDPFMGSGTTAVACIKEKRNFLGSEIDKNYYSVLTKRISNEQSQTSLF